MTKQLIVDVSRHLDSLRDAAGKKWDAPSLYGVTVEAPRVAKELIGSDGEIRFYHSRTARTALGIGLIAKYAGIEKPWISIADALNGMERTPADDREIRKLTHEIEERIAIEDRGIMPSEEEMRNRAAIENIVVEYCTNPKNLDKGTEKPTEVGARYQDHIYKLKRWFCDIKDGQTRRIFNMGHEPCLTALVMQVTGKKYDAAAFSGAARTAEAVKFTMEDTGSGIIQVKMEYRDMSTAYTIR